MASKITSSPAPGEPVTHTEPKHPVIPHELLKAERPLMPLELLVAAIDGKVPDLEHFLGLNGKEFPDIRMSVRTEEGWYRPGNASDCLRSIAGMEDTILHILSANGHEDIVATICTKDSSLLKARNARGETPFHHAARFGHKNTILKLVECARSAFDDDIDLLDELLRQKNCLGETALHEAARHGHGDVVYFLMSRDKKLAGLVNDDSASPLFLATAKGSLDVVKYMLEILSNDDITPAFYSGPKKQTALHAAVLQDQASTGHKIAQLLLDECRSLAYVQDSDGSFPVHTAVRMGHVKMIVLLLQRCPDSGQLLDSKGRNFLHIAIEAKKLEIVFKLLKDSKNKLSSSHWKKMFNKMLNTIDNKGNTPLHLAAEHGYVTVRHSLLENNELDLTLQNKDGQIAFDLSWNVQPSDRPIMSNKLLKAAIDANETDLNELLGTGYGGDGIVTAGNDGYGSALDCCNCLEEAKVLAEKAKDVIARKFQRWNNDKGQHVIQMESSKSDCLKSVTGMGDTILHVLSAYGHGDLLNQICSKDRSLVKERNVRNETPVHHAARFDYGGRSYFIIVQLINFAGAGWRELLRQKNCLGETALHEAARHGNIEAIEILMERDWELAGLVNNDSASPLFLATARGSLDVVQKMVVTLSGHEITPAFYSGPKKQTALHAAVLQDPGLAEEGLTEKGLAKEGHTEEGLTEETSKKNIGLTKEILKLYSEPLGKGDR